VRFALLLVAASLICIKPTLAGENQPAIYPVLGYAEGNLLYVRSYRSVHETIPKELFAYGGGKEFIGRLRTKNSFLPEPCGRRHGCYDDTYMGRFVYEMQKSTRAFEGLVYDEKKKTYEIKPKPTKVDVLIFDTKKNIQSDNITWIDKDTQTEWGLFNLTSNEGGHEIVRVLEGGRCVSHIDYYTYCDYATEADSAEDFKKAMCGVQIDGSDTGF